MRSSVPIRVSTRINTYKWTTVVSPHQVLRHVHNDHARIYRRRIDPVVLRHRHTWPPPTSQPSVFKNNITSRSFAICNHDSTNKMPFPNNYLGIITCAKEVMFYIAFVCLSVCPSVCCLFVYLLATSDNYWSDVHTSVIRDVRICQQGRNDYIVGSHLLASGCGSWKLSKNSCALRDGGFSTIWLIYLGRKRSGFRANFVTDVTWEMEVSV